MTSATLPDSDIAGVRDLSRPSTHRSPPIRLPADPMTSAALVLQYVQTANTSVDRSAAIEAMTARVGRLLDPDATPEELLGQLVAHAAVLDALFQRWSAEAVASKVPDHQMKFVKMALQSQNSYTRALIAIEGLKAQMKSKELPSAAGGHDGAGDGAGRSQSDAGKAGACNAPLVIDAVSAVERSGERGGTDDEGFEAE